MILAKGILRCGAMRLHFYKTLNVVEASTISIKHTTDTGKQIVFVASPLAIQNIDGSIVLKTELPYKDISDIYHLFALEQSVKE